MSKLLRLPLTLLAVLAAMLFLPGIAWGDQLTPSPAQCTANPTLTGCASQARTDTSTGQTPSGTTTDQSQSDPGPVAHTGEGTTSQPQTHQQQTTQQPSGQQAAQSLAVIPLQLPTDAAPVVGVNDVPAAPPNFCDQLPKNPICTGSNPPTGPLTCDQLATLLHLSGGCPQSFSCNDLASLLGVTCPAGAPDCATLAALFHLQGCPQPPTSCQEFADLLGVDNCSQIPCLDTSKLPQQARDGLKPLLDGLKNIGIKQCPPTTTGGTTPPGKGTYMPPTTQPTTDTQQQQPAAVQPAATPTVTTAQPTGKLAYTGLELGPQLNVAWTLLILGTGMLILGRRRV